MFERTRPGYRPRAKSEVQGRGALLPKIRRGNVNVGDLEMKVQSDNSPTFSNNIVVVPNYSFEFP